MQWRLRVPILCTSNLKLYIWLTNLIRATRKAAINNHMRKCFGLTTCWHFCWLNLYALHCYKSSVQENLYTYYKDELKNDSNKNCYQMKLFKLRSNGLLSAVQQWWNNLTKKSFFTNNSSHVMNNSCPPHTPACCSQSKHGCLRPRAKISRDLYSNLWLFF